MTPSAELPAGFDESTTFRAASHGRRLATILAGPAVNIVMAAAAFALASLAEGEPPSAALQAGLADVGHVVTGTASALWLWVSNIGDYLASVLDRSGSTAPPVRFMSPVAQAEVSGWAVDNGIAMSLRWFAILSCAVGAVNLLPLPPLDGSHALAAVAEAAIQRLRPGRVVNVDVSRLLPLAYVTVAALVFLSVSALVLDLRDLT
jgi:membrane-associated protease RseP (regulator of RpoE activity)